MLGISESEMIPQATSVGLDSPRSSSYSTSAEIAPGIGALRGLPWLQETAVLEKNSGVDRSLNVCWLCRGSEVDLPNLPPLFVYGAILVGFVITNLLLAHLLGPRKHTPVKDMPYESGMDPVGDARQPFDVRFYLVAILFLVFDVELLFLYPWAVSAYSDLGIPPELRDTVFAVMLVFMTTLALAWVYAWRKGVFRWR
jgi:NADH-quinone oxidoreductase subunit A